MTENRLLDKLMIGVSEKYSLTPQESKVLSMLLQGYSIPQVAVHLEVSPYTAEKHSQTVLRKLNIMYKRELPFWLLKEMETAKGMVNL
ncbi:helix-turn-helix transcriptional regulator [Brevibacillus agri]|uniref:helix-turn-helix transcriptional regulator n=1 Tax=Brevibacillus TaxID=55080 RepID=UPI001EE56D06|nr:helix-turn-helix transcriptional regulator [Brevibacillus agri]MCG5254125.1 helix-turn-helix transcriptional regulator [Brevibacillus agri]